MGDGMDFSMNTAQGYVVPWLASQDWVVIEP